MKNSNIKIALLTIVAFYSLVVPACKSKTAEKSTTETAASAAEQKAKSDETAAESAVTLTIEQYKAVKIETGSIAMRNLNTIVKANGFTKVPPQNSASVSTLIGGTVQKIAVVEGAYVEKGKVLAILQNLEVVAMQEDYAVALANIEYLQAEYERQKTLSEENVGAKKVFQEVKSKLAVEQARAKAAKTRMDLLRVNANDATGNVPIVSPIGGYVGKILVNSGSYAEVGKPLFEVLDNSQMHLDLNVYEKDLDKIHEGQSVDVVLTNQNYKTLKATIFGINKSFTNESKSVAVHAHINAADVKGLISGMYVSANININNARVMALPKEAVVKKGEKAYIFIEKGEEMRAIEAEGDGKSKQNAPKLEEKIITFQAIEVVTGVTDLGFTEITVVGALPSNAKIVHKGAFYLLSAMVSGGGEEE